MRKILLTLFASLLIPDLALAAVDLTPRFTEFFIDGMSIRRLYFTDRDKKFTVSTNQETDVTPGTGGALFRFKKFPDATFLAIRSRHTPNDKFEGQILDRYRESAKRLLPVQGRNSVIRGESMDCYPINDWKSYRIILGYEVGGLPHLQSVTFINLNDADQVTLVTSAPEKEFDEAAHRSYQIFRTWQEVLPGDEKPARGN